MRFSTIAFFLSAATVQLFAADPKPSPPLRTRAEVQAVLSKSRSTDERAMRQLKRIVLVATVKDHGPGEHDYPAWQKDWLKLLGQAQGVSVSNAWKWPAPQQFDHADVLVFYYWNHDWTSDAYKQLDAFLARGGGVVLLHSSCIADKEPETLAERIGLSAQPKRSKYRHGELDLKFVTPSDHPLTAALPRTIHFLDETYWPLIGDTNKVEVIATAQEEGKDWPMVWTFTKGKGRVFGTVLGHYSTTFDDPFFRILVLRGIAWAAREPASRWEKLATVNARLKEE
jgi:type 1 glutamine amidotransferase